MAAEAPISPGALDAVLEREQAATEERQWVRLTRRCNNGCLFCHDSDRQDGTLTPLPAIVEELKAGRARGATRLVLSGGEPTLHPEVVDAIRLGREAGYRWVQLISNGRLFAYEKFTARAVAAGLDEVTVSIHGHTAELHDHLTGTRGAFSQALKGISNLRRAGRVVSIDVVVSKPNVRHLVELMRLFVAMGIREFDLLHLVPFGRAFDEHRQELFFDAAEERPHVLRALELAREPGMHVWTNRWPAPLLEGAEHLIQDPHKVLDEVRGTREGFEAYLVGGVEPWCRGERCAHCFMEPFCRTLFDAKRRLGEGDHDVVVLDAQAPAPTDAQRRAVARQARARLRVKAPDPAAAARTLAAWTHGQDARELELDVGGPGPLDEALARRVRRVAVRSAAQLGFARALGGVEVEVALERATEPLAMQALADGLQVVLTRPGRALLSEVLEHDPAPEALRGAAASCGSEGLPSCLAPSSAAPRAVLDTALLRPDGALDLLPWAEGYVAGGYRTRSLRCRGCAREATCPGAHVNYVRAHGFSWMQPLAEGGA